MDKFLHQFKVIAESGSFSHASEMLHISQPALTQNIKKLESRYEISLFNRSHQGVSLTAYGQILYGHVRAMENIEKQANEKIEEFKNKKGRSLLIGTGHFFWELYLKDALRKYHSIAPKASLHIEFGNNLYLFDRTLSGHLDIIFGHEILGLSHNSDMVFMPLLESDRAWFVRSSHPLAGKKACYTDMDSFPLLEITGHDSRYKEYIKHVEENPIEQERLESDHRVIMSTNSITAGLEFLQTQDVILGFPIEYRSFMEQHDIVPLQLDTPPLKERIGAYYRNNGLNSSLEELIQILIPIVKPVFDTFRYQI
ncbi:LysR family transcriptional regulator [Sansalvadorimonas sp. 2012CJ34-2]|uniref:LysR family transcriptional regulator n=1 Tax=Parendozoicomonas callyspongiae TaxID=2942213 RepID=A0ABT0PEG3_9GAMM|nr:LysR family transcriptional regulator [Sansalvadorimonas sp. 2012CJ34-2]MCL6269646.1 LysR family transcriptional regulator [Sansalvadorimonas sp. 2012CJ34-2]